VPAKYKKVKEFVLGKQYELSFAFVTPAQMRKAMKYKKKRATKVSNVLAFALSKTSGEILICKSAAKPYTPDYLFIHALYHLKGYKHSDRMESEENQTLQKFNFQRLATRV